MYASGRDIVRGRFARRLALLLAAALLALTPGTATAATGSDYVRNAAALTFAIPGTAGNTTFGTETAEPLGGGCPAERTAWWRIAGNGQAITLSTTGSNFDTAIAVFDAGSASPSAANRIGCNDNAGGAQTSLLSFSSVRGTSYLVQVGGGTLAASGSIVLSASGTRPANDDASAAQVLQTGAPAVVANIGASQETGESLACGTVPFAATIWFRWTSPATTDAIFSSSAPFGDTVLVVYKVVDGRAVGCGVGAPSSVPIDVVPGDYLVQVGTRGYDGPPLGEGPFTVTAALSADPDADNDGVPQSRDCDDHDGGRAPGLVEGPNDGIDQDCDGSDLVFLFDADHDGYGFIEDCNDHDPKIHPKAIEIKGNAIDENCDGVAEPYPRLPSKIRSFVARSPLRFTLLSVGPVVAGSRIELRCTGRGCFRNATIHVRKAAKSLSLLRYVRSARPKRGAVIQFRVTKPGTIGAERRLTARGAAAKPKLENLCLTPGAKRAARC
jgi:hypothetical protein